jgi:predicted small lipoprotein YifL
MKKYSPLLMLALILAACGVQRPLIPPKDVPAYNEEQRKKRKNIEKQKREDEARAAAQAKAAAAAAAIAPGKPN